MILTVFTPTYNRADLLKCVYDSLLQQNISEIEWIVVDDGSTDHTEMTVSEFKKANKLNIIYIKKENGGKHSAHNTALQWAKGKYFMCLDSDDVLMEDIIQKITAFEQDMMPSDCGFIGYKEDCSGKLLSTEFPHEDLQHLGMCAYQKKMNITGEFTFIFLTDIIKKYPFPLFQNERFIGENVVYDRLEKDGFTFCPLRQTIQICEYQASGLSDNYLVLMKQNPAGFCLYFMQRINLQDNLRDRMVTAGKYHAFCIFAGNQKSKYDGKHRIMVAGSKPLGLIFWLYYKLLRGF